MLLYVKRWLEAPPQREYGTTVPKDRGTRQESAISPLLANLFLQYEFDNWLAKHLSYVKIRRPEPITVTSDRSSSSCCTGSIFGSSALETGPLDRKIVGPGIDGPQWQEVVGKIRMAELEDPLGSGHILQPIVPGGS